MPVTIGDRIPAAQVYVLTPDGPSEISTDSLFGGKRIALFGVPGAFTRTCSAQHLPGFVAHAAALRAAGIDEVMCLSVNDPFVLAAWSRQHGADGSITMVGDGSLNLTRALGLEADMSARGFGKRCRRFSMIVNDTTITHFHVEPDAGFGETSAERLLEDL